MKATQHSNTLREILAQPDCWRRTIDSVAQSDLINVIRTQSGDVAEWLFVGCGTSYYLAQAAAATHRALTGIPARAVPASEVFLYPELALRNGMRCLPVLISRSGRTSEVLRAAEFLKNNAGVETIAITCDGNQLKEVADWTMELPVEEQSTVMTSSFTSMLVALQYVSASVAGNHSFLESLGKLPFELTRLLDKYVPNIETFIRQYSFDDYIYLGQGPYVGIAAEAALKVTESSCSYAQSFHTMEFRHGPKSIVSPRTMIGLFVSELCYAEEASVLREMSALGGTIFTVTNRADDTVRKNSHCVIELDLDLPELALLTPSVVWGQLLGVLTGIEKGLNPDNPKNLTRAVILGD